MNKKKFEKQSISFRLTRNYATMMFVTLIAMSVFIIGAVYYYQYNTSRAQLWNISDSVVQILRQGTEITDDELYQIAQMNENIEMNISHGEQIIFTNSENGPIDLKRNTVDTVGRYNTNGKNILYINRQVDLGADGVIMIQIIKDMDNENEYIQFILWIIVILDSVMLLFSILLGFIMSRHALKPIDGIVMQAQQITINDLSQRILIDGPEDELKKLANTFNELIERVEAGYELQNRFALDASHELSTPLAVIKGYLDIIQRWGKHDPEVLNEAIMNMQKEMGHTINLLETLLFIAKGDNEISKIKKSEFDINELLNEIYNDAQVIYPNHHFEINQNQSSFIYADKELIRQMIRDLTDNGVKYSERGTTVTISCENKGNSIILGVTDQGIGISHEDINYIFDRFYRVDKARSREAGGTGLGLSIVKWIVDQHEGKIKVDTELGKGTTFYISLPLGETNLLIDS